MASSRQPFDRLPAGLRPVSAACVRFGHRPTIPPPLNFRKILARRRHHRRTRIRGADLGVMYAVFRAYLDERPRHGAMADMTVPIRE